MEIAAASAAYTAPFAAELALAASIATAGAMVGYALGKRKRDSDAEDREEATRRRVERADDIDRVERGLDGQAKAVRRLADNVAAKLQEQEARSERMDNLRAELVAQVQQIEADVADTYRKHDTDQKLAAKADVADTYSKQDTDQKLAAKAAVADTYSKQDTDQKLAAKAAVADTYRKQEIDQKLARRDEEAKRAELSCWSLHVGNPYQYNEGYNGHFAMSGNHFLIQDADHTTKKAGVATNTGSPGFIQATFPKPVHVRTVKIAAFHKIFRGGISHPSGGTVTLSVQSPETGEFETLRQDIPYSTQEEVFPVNKTILALRLSGIYISISKLIFS